MAAMVRLELLFFLLWAGVAVSSGMDLQKRVINGMNCTVTERLYHVALVRKGRVESIFCGGSLIRDQWILTAAHCLEWRMYAFINIHSEAEKLIKLNAAEAHIYRDDSGEEHDIMLLKLPEELTGTFHKATLPVDCEESPKKNDRVGVAGFGCSGVDSDMNFDHSCKPKNLQCGNMTVEDCPPHPVVSHLKHIQRENWICANGATVTAKGDSGGGLEFSKELHGVISHGPPRIAFSRQSKFMRVCEYMDWILQTTKKK